MPWIAADPIAQDLAVEWQDPAVKGETLGFGPSFMFFASGITLTIGAIVGLSFREIRELL